MNYQSYRQWKESLNLDGYLRLDCMNPAKAMAFLNPENNRHSNAADYIRSLYPPHIHITFMRGIRASLLPLLRSLGTQRCYLPQEVYPVYFDIAQELSPTGYSIFNPQSLQSLEKANIVYTLNHFGSLHLDPQAAERLIAAGNTVIMDAVYDYGNEVSNYLHLLESGKLFILCSLSKTQLSREFGYLLHRSSLSLEAPSDNLYIDPQLPQRQLHAIELRWQQIAEISPYSVLPTAHPYFRIIEQSFTNLIKEQIVSIPLSVFSNNESDSRLSVVSPLYEIHKHLSSSALGISR